MTRLRDDAVLVDADGANLIGICHVPADSSGVGVVVVPGAPQYRAGPHRLFVMLGRHLARQGHTVLRIDRRGYGDSEGEAVPFDQMAPDIEMAISALQDHDPRVKSVMVLGLCDGASGALLHAALKPAVHGLILLNPWVSTEAGRAQAVLKGYYLPRFARWRRWLAVLGSFARLRKAVASIARALLDSLRPTDGAGAIPPFAVQMLRNWVEFKGRTLVVLSGQDIDATAFDQFIGRTLGWSPLIEAADTKVIRLRSADHTFTDLADREALFANIDEWIASDPYH